MVARNKDVQEPDGLVDDMDSEPAKPAPHYYANCKQHCIHGAASKQFVRHSKHQ